MGSDRMAEPSGRVGQVFMPGATCPPRFVVAFSKVPSGGHLANCCVLSRAMRRVTVSVEKKIRARCSNFSGRGPTFLQCGPGLSQGTLHGVQQILSRERPDEKRRGMLRRLACQGRIGERRYDDCCHLRVINTRAYDEVQSVVWSELQIGDEHVRWIFVNEPLRFVETRRQAHPEAGRLEARAGAEHVEARLSLHQQNRPSTLRNGHANTFCTGASGSPRKTAQEMHLLRRIRWDFVTAT